MPKSKNSYTLYVAHLPILLLILVALVATSGVLVAKNSNSNVLGKSDNAKSSEKGKEKAKAKNEDSKEHKQKVEAVAKSLKEVAKNEERRGNVRVSAELEEIAETQESSAEEVATVIEELENKSKWQRLLFGTDYKNLGQLRSSLAHNTNDIRKLTRLSGDLESTESSGALQLQLATLNLERQRIVDVIETNESQFSLLGWVFKLLNGFGGSDDGETSESTGSL